MGKGDCNGQVKREGVSDGFAWCEPGAPIGETEMHTGARQVRQMGVVSERGRANGERHSEMELRGGRTRVFVAAENRVMHDALSRMLGKRAEIEVLGTANGEPVNAEAPVVTYQSPAHQPATPQPTRSKTIVPPCSGMR